jgi:hypothetical protein
MTEHEIEETLNALQSLKQHPGYEYLMQWVADSKRTTFGLLLSEKDSVQMAKHVGRMSMLMEISERVDSEIKATLEYLKSNVDAT